MSELESEVAVGRARSHRIKIGEQEGTKVLSWTSQIEIEMYSEGSMFEREEELEVQLRINKVLPKGFIKWLEEVEKRVGEMEHKCEGERPHLIVPGDSASPKAALHNHIH
jgi:hypothetical protein